MANYHFTTKNIARKGGKSCVASLAYRSATKLEDQQTGEIFNYTDKAFVGPIEILLPENAPQWARDIAKECETTPQTALQKLSDIFEAAEKRIDARVYREIEFSLPNELTKEENIKWATHFIKDTCVKNGMVAIMNFHFDVDEETGEAKPHCHVLLSTRELTDKGLSPSKQRDWNRVELLQEWREQCAQYQNAALKQYGFEARVDHRSYADRGLTEMEPQPKRGKSVSQMGVRGLETDKQKAFDFVRLRNQFKILKSPELVFSIVTSNHSTFTSKDVAKVVHRYIDNAEQFQALYHRLLNSKELVNLDSTQGAEPIFTTVEMLRLEMSLVQKAGFLSAQKNHGVEATIIEQAITRGNEKLQKYGGLSLDQGCAIRHMLSDEQISCVIGFAGAGKTTSLEIVQEAWHEAGYKVVGLAPTGRAAENMEKSGLRSMTIHKFLAAQKDGREQISTKTVLVIDEAGMVDSRRFAELLSLAEKRGAKIVSIGDGNQLQAVEAGPAFRLITSRLKPAVLEKVVRQQEEWQQEATRLFGITETRKALELYQEKGTFKIIQENKPDPQNVVETYCLARQMSGHIWKEMQADINSGKTVGLKEVAQHQDYTLYQHWRNTRQEMVEKIIVGFDKHKLVLESKGLDLGGLIADYQASGDGTKPIVFEQIEALFRKMSYETLVDTRVQAKQALVTAWAEDRAEKPAQSHLMLAFTNKDAANLNETARTLMRDQGEITGTDFRIETCKVETDEFGCERNISGTKTFAKGDRLLFTRNDNSLGVKNGTLGMILSISSHKITVVLDDSDNRQISFAPKLYSFIDNGWATTIHKAQGATVDHVKKLASFEEYRNLAYVGMSRHRRTLEVFASDLDFWRKEKIIDRLSRVQEKLSGIDYLDSENIVKQLKADKKILWHEKKVQQGWDLWNAVKVTTRTALDQIFDGSKIEKKSQEVYQSFDNSEEKRSSILFTFKESLPATRAKFEAQHQEKYREVCEFFEFRNRFGRAPTAEDRPTIQLMGEQLTHLAGRLFHEQALKEGSLPKISEISKQAYQEFALRPERENRVAERIAKDYGLLQQTAQTMGSLMLTQQDISGGKSSKTDERIALKLAEFASQRVKEIASEQHEPLVAFLLGRELGQMCAYVLHHGSMPPSEKVKEIQDSVRIEVQKMGNKIHQDHQVQRLREQSVRQGMKL